MKELRRMKEILFLVKNPEFERMPCLSFDEFLDNPYYLGIGDDVYRKIREEGSKIWKGILREQYTEGVCLWGIGSGKSFLAVLLNLMFVQYLLCMKNTHSYFNLVSDKPIAVVNMGTTARQAKNVIFSGIRKLIEDSPFFGEFNPNILQTEIRFKEKNIALYCGNSQETMPIGMNVIFGSLDEAAWYLDNENKSLAEEIYNTLKNRIVSRFGDRGFLFVISAPRYIDDFISKKYNQGQVVDYIYATSNKTWEIKDREKMKAETFKFRVDEHEEWEVPVDFKKVAEANPEKFMRDFGARPSLVIEAFDRDGEIIERNVNKDRENPLDEAGRFKEWFRGDDKERHIHIDLALKRDACGIAMGHAGDDENVVIDLMMQIKAPKDGEIEFEKIRQIVYDLQDRGFEITLVTFDQFQSADTIQILKGRGIKAELLSVDRTLEPYNTLKSLLHNNKVDYYHFEPFEKEYKRLELLKGKKIDHPATGSKDVTDAVAGICFSLISMDSRRGFLEYMKEAAKDKPKVEDSKKEITWKDVWEYNK